MRSRYLRQKIRIQSATETQDSFGAISTTWSTFADVYADIMPIRGNEFFIVHQEKSQATIKFTIRYLSGLTTKHRILYDSRVFDIESIINIKERNREMILMCRELT